MLKKHSQLFEGFFMASDLLMVTIAWCLSYWVRFFSEYIPAEKGIPELEDYLKMLLFVWLIWAFVFRKFRLYLPMRGKSRLYEWWLLIRANALGVVILLAATYLFREKSIPFSRLVFVIFWGLATSLTIFSRSFIRYLLRRLRSNGYNLRFAVIVGAGSLAKTVVSKMLSHPEFGVELVGCLTSEGEFDRIAGQKGLLNREYQNDVSIAASYINPEGLRVIGGYADLPELLATGRIDQIIVALPLADLELMGAILNSIGDSIADVKIVPDIYQFIQLGSTIEEFDGLPVVSIASTPLNGFNRILKRSVDVLMGGVIFAATLPLMLFIALLVRLTSRGPIFYAQERVGLDGQPFNIYKFRTMQVGAESNGARFATPRDNRTTVIGGFLRRFSLDELPQLVNVLRGQMSLVGPRPERPVFIAEFKKYIPRYMLRHKVQAGMTGWAQVHGWRGNTSIARRIEHDLYYIENWSLGLDLKILGMTIVNGLWNRNAY